MLPTPWSRLPRLKLSIISPLNKHTSGTKPIIHTIAAAPVRSPDIFKSLSRINYSQATRNMSSFSNANTGSKPADPYTSTNKDDPSIEQKFETLDKFITSRNFGMMTTRDFSSGKLVSRCMAVAAKVRELTNFKTAVCQSNSCCRKQTAPNFCFSPIPNQTRPMN